MMVFDGSIRSIYEFNKYRQTTQQPFAPGQPVADLENYMTSLEKKNMSLKSMVAKITPCAAKDENCEKSFGIKVV